MYKATFKAIEVTSEAQGPRSDVKIELANYLGAFRVLTADLPQQKLHLNPNLATFITCACVWFNSIESLDCLNQKKHLNGHGHAFKIIINYGVASASQFLSKSCKLLKIVQKDSSI